MAKLKWIPLSIAAIFFFLLGSSPHVHTEAESTLDTDTVRLRLMETTDLHARIMPFSYKENQPVNTFGLALTASLIRQARSEVKNSMLFDDGDALKGSLLGEYTIAKGLRKGEVHPVFRAMNTLGYDAATIGNHEFNLGLSLLSQSLRGANFPYINANVYYDDHDDNPDNDRHYFTPYLILPRTFVDENGHERTIKIGVIGFVVPQAIQWNKKYEDLEGILKVKDIYETAKKYVPIMKKNGADIIIALSHSGLGTPKVQYMEQNASYDLTKIDGIDAILFGHVHKVFPSREFAGLPNVNLKKGTVNGIPAVEAGRWGNFLGIIDLSLRKTESGWEVTDSHSSVRPVYNPFSKKATVQPDQEVLDAIKEAHEATLNFLLTPEGALLKAR